MIIVAIFYMSKSGAIDLLDNSVLDDHGYIKNACQTNKYYFDSLV